jgi:3',5'-cyclic AMP phosphodiesterase CpdA
VDVGTDPVTVQTKNLKAETFTFAHVSDSQSSENTGVHFGAVLSNIVGKNDFVLHTGDVVEDSKVEIEWKNMLDTNFAYLSKIPVMAISGNHETTYKNGSNETYKHFNQKIGSEQDTKLGYYYSFTYGNAKFIMLNTNRLTGNALTVDQYDWLINELENNTATWTFVAMHNPMYSAGNYGSDPSRNAISVALRNQLQSIFAEYGVDVVLQGHDHLVSHTHPIDKTGNPISSGWENIDGVDYVTAPSGVIYEMSGPAGRQTRSPNSHMNASLYHKAQASNMCSWAEFAIEGNKLTVTHKYTNMTSVGEYGAWGIIKSA